MFASGPNYNKLKTNLRLAINRLKLLEKKKTELAQKARKEIADYLTTGKTARAKIRVEQIIREDYLVEALELTEMYCDQVLSRFGLLQQLRGLDEGLSEAISSLLWVSPRLQTDVPELHTISHHLTLKYGKPYTQGCRGQKVDKVSKRLISRLSMQAPSKVLVEEYLLEIAKNYNINYVPDPQVLRREGSSREESLLDTDGPLEGCVGGTAVTRKGASEKSGWLGATQGHDGCPGAHRHHFCCPEAHQGHHVCPGAHQGHYRCPGYDDPRPHDAYVDPKLDMMYSSIQRVSGSNQWENGMSIPPPPAYSTTPYNMAPNAPLHDAHTQQEDLLNLPHITSGSPSVGEQDEYRLPDLPELPDDLLPPATPKNSPNNTNTREDIDFDDLSKRFENLKKRK
nr:IST1 homolog isoform X1 [Procambarus clarkii]